jgi:hypothetical protein
MPDFKVLLAVKVPPNKTLSEANPFALLAPTPIISTLERS